MFEHRCFSPWKAKAHIQTVPDVGKNSVSDEIKMDDNKKRAIRRSCCFIKSSVRWSANPVTVHGISPGG